MRRKKISQKLKEATIIAAAVVTTLTPSLTAMAVDSAPAAVESEVQQEEKEVIPVQEEPQEIPAEQTNETPAAQEKQPETPAPEASSAEIPVAEAPEPETSVIEEPSTEAPEPETPVIEEPSTEAPEPETPVVEEPSTETPEPETPVVEEPSTETPEPETPVVEEPSTETPEPETPVVEEPSTETPEPETPVVEEPSAETPEPGTPGVENPDASASETPVGDASEDDTVTETPEETPVADVDTEQDEIIDQEDDDDTAIQAKKSELAAELNVAKSDDVSTFIHVQADAVGLMTGLPWFNEASIKRISAPLNQQEFMNEIGIAAVKHYKTSGILPSLTISQAILESGWGTTGLSQYNNLFGMKWRGANENTSEFISMVTSEQDAAGNAYCIVAAFSAYETVDDCVNDRFTLLSNSRYKNLKGVTDYKEACDLIRADGYATDVNYALKLKTIIARYGLQDWDIACGAVEGTIQSKSVQKAVDSINTLDNLLAADTE